MSPGLEGGLIPAPGAGRLEAPQFGADEPSPDFKLPIVPPPSQDAPLSERLRVFVNAFRILGNTVLPEQKLRELTAPYIGREISSAELEQLRRELTLAYINSGYATSGVVIPDQDIKDGVLTLRVIEGVLADVQVTGLERLHTDYVRERMIARAGDVLNVQSLQEQLQLLNQSPLISELNGRLEPGARLGESVLLLDVRESSPYELDLTVNNQSAPSIGGIKGTVRAAHRNLSGRGDTAQLELGRTTGLYSVDAFYSIPVTAHDTTASFRYKWSESEVVEQPFNAIDIESKSQSFSFSLSQPVHRSLSRSVTGTLTLDVRGTETFLLGRRFSFSPGTKDGKSRVTALRLIGDWVERGTDQVMAFRTTVSWGTELFGATDNAAAPDGQFVSVLGQLQWVRRFGENQNQVVFRADGQLVDDGLLPLEKFAVGGAASVRGYRENQLVRDNGWVSSLELRIPVLHDAAGASRTQFAVFLDAGRSWNKTDPSPDPEFISSAGVGLRWDPTSKLHAELYWARAFRNVDQTSNDPQDEGVHFLLRYSAF